MQQVVQPWSYVPLPLCPKKPSLGLSLSPCTSIHHNDTHRLNQFLDLDILLGHRLTQTSPVGFAHPDLPRIYDKYITYEHDRNHQFYIFGRQETCMNCKLKTKFSELLWYTYKKTHIDWIHQQTATIQLINVVNTWTPQSVWGRRRG